MSARHYSPHGEIVYSEADYDLLQRVEAGLLDARRQVRRHARKLELAAARKLRPLRKFVDDYKMARGCQVCGIAAPAYILDLHHIDPKTKLFSVANATSIAKAAEEATKCVVLCAIHHRMVEAGDLPCPKEA